MDEIKFTAIGVTRISPMQQREMEIKRLKYWNKVLLVSNTIYTLFMVAVIYMGLTR